MTTPNERTETETFEMPPDTIISSEAVFKAAEGTRTFRVFPSDHEYYRTWLIAGAHGSVTFHDAGNHWCQIVNLDTESQEHELAFWQRLGEIISGNPNQVQEIEPGFVTDLLAKYGLYDADLMMNS